MKVTTLTMTQIQTKLIVSDLAAYWDVGLMSI